MKDKKVVSGIIVVVILAIAVVFIADRNKNASSGDIVRVEEWMEKHPDIYRSYMANVEMSKTTYGGSVQVDYLEEDPNLLTFYDGYGFSKEYLRARGHIYALDDVINTVRPKGGASCLSCKTADFHLALEEDGIEVNKMDFDQFLEENPETSTISCYDCHRNNPGTINITREHLNVGFASLNSELASYEITSPNNQVCAQCHTEYYLDSDTNEVVLPWDNGLETEGMLDYYDKIAFSDWEHPSTGAKLLKAQHPEYETFSGSKHDAVGLSCTDCHMPEVAGEDNLKSHHWTSPLKSPEGMTESCMTCHSGTTDGVTAWVEEVQRQVTDKMNEISDELVDFVDRLSAAVEDNAIEGSDLEKLQDIHRRAQFKWDFVFVENSEGFHNSDKAHMNLDDARELIQQGNTILEKYEN